MKVQEKHESRARRAGHHLMVLVFVLATGAGFAAEPFEIICDGEATGLSSDGSVVVGIAKETRETWRWTKKSGRVLLERTSGTADEIDWGTPDVSADGRVVSTTVYSESSGSESLVQWSEKDGWVTSPAPSRDLGDRGNNSRANDSNSDGSIIVGWSENPATGIWQPTVWTDGKPVILVATKAFCEATAATPDGKIIVGQTYDESRDQRAAALWLNSDFGWVQEWLGTLPGTIGGYGQAMALDLTDDGHTIVGFNSFDPNRSTGFIWTLEDGLSDVHVFLADHGVTLPEGFRINSITGISGDGSFMTGFGEDTTFWPHQTRSFLICVKAFPKKKPSRKILPAGTDISNPFKTRDLE